VTGNIIFLSINVVFFILTLLFYRRLLKKDHDVKLKYYKDAFETGKMIGKAQALGKSGKPEFMEKHTEVLKAVNNGN